MTEQYDLVLHAPRAVIAGRRGFLHGRRSWRTHRRGRGFRHGPRRRSRRDAGRRRGAAARPGGHPRARQRSRPHRVGGLRQRHQGGRRGRRHHDRRHAAEQPAADGRCRGPRGETQGGARRTASSTSASGAARFPAMSPTFARCTTPGCSGSSVSWPIPVSRSSRGWSRRSSSPRVRAVAEFDGLMIVHAEDAHALEHAPSADGRGYGGFLASRPRGAENLAIAEVIEAARWTGCRLHILHLSSADALPMIRSARARRPAADRRGLPALPDLHRRGDSRRGNTIQVLPADPGGGQPGRTVGGRRGRHHRLHRVRPLAVHARAEAAGHR